MMKILFFTSTKNNGSSLRVFRTSRRGVYASSNKDWLPSNHSAVQCSAAARQSRTLVKIIKQKAKRDPAWTQKIETCQNQT
jgi:hypothetical protein